MYYLLRYASNCTAGSKHAIITMPESAGLIMTDGRVQGRRMRTLHEVRQQAF